MAKRQGGTYTAKWVRLPPCALINNNIKYQLTMEHKIDVRNSKTLHLVLKRKWWDMIESGEKKEEYRDVNHYWAVRLIDRKYHCHFNKDSSLSVFMACLSFRMYDSRLVFCKYENVCFHLGYSNKTMSFKINSIFIASSDSCRQDWGAEPEKYYFVIKLGERIEQ